MAKARALDKRRKAIRNIRKITRTMELIATARFKKAMDRAHAATAYTRRITQLVADLANSGLDPDTLTTRHHLGLLYASMDKPDLAIAMLEETLAVRKAKLGPEHPTTLDTQSDLAINYCNAGRQSDGVRCRCCKT